MSKCQMSKLFDIRFQVASSNHYLYSAFIVIVESVPVYEGRDLLPKSEARVFSWNWISRLKELSRVPRQRKRDVYLLSSDHFARSLF